MELLENIYFVMKSCLMQHLVHTFVVEVDEETFSEDMINGVPYYSARVCKDLSYGAYHMAHGQMLMRY